MKTKTLSIIVLLLFGFSALPAKSAIILDFDPSIPYTVNAGDTFDVDVVISGLGSQIVAAFDLDVSFDATTLQANSVAFGPWLGDFFSFEVQEAFNLDNIVGLVDFAAVSFLSDIELASLQAPSGGSLVLATLNFTASQNATTGLDFIWAPFNDIKGAGNKIIYPVAEPSLLLFLLFGGALTMFCRRALRKVEAK